MKEFVKNNIKALYILIAVIFIGLIGVTFAAVANFLNVNVSTGTYNVVYSGTATLPTSKLQPVVDANLLDTSNASKVMKIDFTVKGAETNPTTKKIIYDVSLTNLNLTEGMQHRLLKWRLYKNGSLLSEGNFSKDFDFQVNSRMVLTETQQDLPNYSSTADSYSFYVWLSEECSGDITTCTPDQDISELLDKTISGEIRIELSTGSKKKLNRPQMASNKVMSLASSDACAEGGTGVCATNSFETTNGTEYHDYRYRGAEPNNYVKFNNDLYRIIGVFDEQTHGVEGQYLIKLIRSRILGDYSWGVYSTLDNISNGTFSERKNDWTGNKGRTDATDNTSPANLNILLNEYFYNKSSKSNRYGACSNWTYYYSAANYKSFSCSDIVGRGIDYDYRSYIEEVTWHLNGYESVTHSKQDFYLCERGLSSDTTYCMSSNLGTYETSINAHIGLMYVSDYLYASSYYKDASTQIGTVNYYGNKNWLYKGNEWTITPKTDSLTNVFLVYGGGSINQDSAGNSHGVRPTFYLKSSIGIISGMGTIDNPYIIST